ncbi:hypothetical protein Vretimale_15443 [Volvox reticuliferus]|uniref:Uncharacterized protein n=1 Tax=Volvox reticuliferus TaxID=1737510 RepID=A0A8J4FWB0_9CHLO|nr:hypothetical protein Vretifemale_20489 [Volvox reticuliferus]GIM12054.1 hypothetical protein Vretimale_15443 [Volvox reticuliferus]
MELDSSFTCGGWSMHQPIDWDYPGVLSDMFAPLSTPNPASQHPQPLAQEQQQTAMATGTTLAPLAAPTYSTFHGIWASPMHQPVDWEVPALISMTAPAAALASAHAVHAPTAAHTLQQQPSQLHVQVPTTSSMRPKTAVPTTSQLLNDAGGTNAGGGSGGGVTTASGSKRDRTVRRLKSTPLRPQQQQLLDLQMKLNVLMAEHADVEAENERLKIRLRVLEAVLPVRQQQARWAQSREAAERAAERAAAPPDPLIVNLLDLAVSGPSSCCAASPSQQEGAAATPTPTPTPAAKGIITAIGGGSGCCHADDGGGAAAAAATADNMIAGSSTPIPPIPAEPAPCASSSCGAATTTTTTTSGDTDANPPAPRNHHNRHNDHPRSCSLNTTNARGCDRNRYQYDTGQSHRGCHGHTRGRSHGSCGGGGGGGYSRERGVDSHDDSQSRWLDAWRAWVREAALLLQAHDARPNDHYLNRLADAFMKLKSEVVYLGLRHPELVCNMRSVNLETAAEREFPPDSFWVPVVAGMKLDTHQVANCKSALALYRERMAVVLAERRSLAAQMSACLTALQLEEADGRAAPGSLRREQLTLEAEEAALALDANVAVEGHTTSLARDLLGSNLFSRLQVARASVLSYPYFPDALAIITAAVGEQPPLEQPSSQLQPQPTRSGDALQPPVQA